MNYNEITLGDVTFKRTNEGVVTPDLDDVMIRGTEISAFGKWINMERPILSGDTVVILTGYWSGQHAEFITANRGQAFLYVDIWDVDRCQHSVEPINNIRRAEPGTEPPAKVETERRKRARIDRGSCGCGEGCSPGHCINVPA